MRQPGQVDPERSCRNAPRPWGDVRHLFHGPVEYSLSPGSAFIGAVCEKGRVPDPSVIDGDRSATWSRLARPDQGSLSFCQVTDNMPTRRGGGRGSQVKCPNFGSGEASLISSPGGVQESSLRSGAGQAHPV